MIGTPMARLLRLKFVVEDVDRHGNVRLYFRRPGQPKVRLPAEPGSNAFMLAYQKALGGIAPYRRTINEAATTETFRWLCERYFASAEWKRLDASTRAKRRAILEGCCREPRKPGSSDLIADCPLPAFTAGHVKVLRDRKLNTPEAANGRVKAVRRLFAFALKEAPPLAVANIAPRR